MVLQNIYWIKAGSRIEDSPPSVPKVVTKLQSHSHINSLSNPSKIWTSYQCTELASKGWMENAESPRITSGLLH